MSFSGIVLQIYFVDISLLRWVKSAVQKEGREADYMELPCSW